MGLLKITWERCLFRIPQAKVVWAGVFLTCRPDPGTLPTAHGWPWPRSPRTRPSCPQGLGKSRWTRCSSPRLGPCSWSRTWNSFGLVTNEILYAFSQQAKRNPQLRITKFFFGNIWTRNSRFRPRNLIFDNTLPGTVLVSVQASLLKGLYVFLDHLLLVVVGRVLLGKFKLSVYHRHQLAVVTW